ncbi:hypothetical protein Metvu_0325 [Methanocaldococcus vulcanius M7]|uniref:Uncharacterized protein n=1 Tax=Methanocaldococcus vulcanius (strain ATCC 700851 / DSM 12094 / M7) TaxID=579137 RepID=C9RF40_METVM|nr:hypothetical protein [Methanocaldococcus vulcanius]ACX72192.1 hypothetical protein Metvu_0325 [Methanocaldococcus vulcanius M7]
MKFLEKGVYKVFAGLVLVSMIGALVAEPVAVGDVGATMYYILHNKEGHQIFNDGVSATEAGGAAVTAGGILMEVAEEGSIMYMVGAGLCIAGAPVVALGLAAIA